MDELTRRLLRRVLRRKRSLLLILTGVAFFVGWITPVPLLLRDAPIMTLTATWCSLAWTAADRHHPLMRAVLTAPSGRRAWLVAQLTVSAVLTGIICFAVLAPHGLRVAAGMASLAFVYGWILGTLGLSVVLPSRYPREMARVGGMAILIAVLTLFDGTDIVSVWHPLALFGGGMARALAVNSRGSDLHLWLDPRIAGFTILTLLSLVSWRAVLRAVERIESLPVETA